MSKNTRFFVFLCVFLLILSMPVTASANSAEPPGIIVIVLGAPEDVELSLEFPGTTEGETRTSRADAVWEQHFRFYYYVEMEQLEDACIRVTSSSGSFTCPLPEGVTNHYNNLLTLHYGSQSLTMGQPAWRQPLYIALRVGLTLLIEGVIFFLFGFRKKRSWAVFLLVNLITQLWVNIFVAGNAFSGGYWFFGYAGIEILIFLGEGIVFPMATKERPKWKFVLYALAANLASLLLGGWLISNLPI